MSLPDLSLITINYNNASGLERTFKSVFSQINQSFEYIVIDGGSTDGSKQVIERFESNIHIRVSEPDKGIYNAMNKGLEKAKGTYVLFINSGDELNGDDALNKAIPFLDGTDIIYSDLMLLSEGREQLKLYPDKLTFQYFLNDSLPHPATFIKRKLIIDEGGYDENLKVCSDWRFFVIALFKTDASYKHIPLTLSRFYLDGLSSSTPGREIILKEKKEIVAKNFAGFIDLIEEWRQNRELKELVAGSRLIKYAKKMGFLKAINIK